MTDKKRWNDPANEGQVNLMKVGVRFFAIIMIWALAAVVKIALENRWIESFSQMMGY